MNQFECVIKNHFESDKNIYVRHNKAGNRILMNDIGSPAGLQVNPLETELGEVIKILRHRRLPTEAESITASFALFFLSHSRIIFQELF
jgi:hypothetical protein